MIEFRQFDWTWGGSKLKKWTFQQRNKLKINFNVLFRFQKFQKLIII